MASSVDICNRALQKLGASRIVSLSQDSTSARACNIAYEPVRNAELRAHSWNFAIKRVLLASDVTTPEYGYDFQYTLPSDCLRLLPNDLTEGAYDTNYKIEGKKIRTNQTAPLRIRYISRVEDTTQYDDLFIEALSCKLAMEMCEELTQSNSKRQLAAEEYKLTIREARKINAFENPPSEQRESTWILDRL